MKFQGDFLRILFIVFIMMKKSETKLIRFKYDLSQILEKQVLKMSQRNLADAEYKFRSNINVTIRVLQNSTIPDCCIRMVLLEENSQCSCVDSCGAVSKLGCTNEFINETVHIVTEFRNCSQTNHLVSISKTTLVNENYFDSCEYVAPENYSSSTPPEISTFTNPRTTSQTPSSIIATQPTSTPLPVLPGLGMFTFAGGGKSSTPIKTTPTMPSYITVQGNINATSDVNGLPDLKFTKDNFTAETTHAPLSTKLEILDSKDGGKSSHPVVTSGTVSLVDTELPGSSPTYTDMYKNIVEEHTKEIPETSTETAKPNMKLALGITISLATIAVLVMLVLIGRVLYKTRKIKEDDANVFQTDMSMRFPGNEHACAIQSKDFIMDASNSVSPYYPGYVNIRKISESNTDDDDASESPNSSPESEKRVSSVPYHTTSGDVPEPHDKDFEPYKPCTTFGKDGGCFKISRPKLEFSPESRPSGNGAGRRIYDDVYAVSYKKRSSLR